MKEFKYRALVYVKDLAERESIAVTLKGLGYSRIPHSKHNRAPYFRTFGTGRYEQNNRYCNVTMDWSIDTVDVGDNTNLFVAISAVNDTDDYMQWFINTRNGNWYLHTEVEFKEYWVEREDGEIDIRKDFRKATKKELIERLKHFK